MILKTEKLFEEKNDQKIYILAKVHLQELGYLKQNNNILTKNVEELERRLASQDIDISNVQNILKATSEKIKYKCDHCMFESQSMRGIKTHTGHLLKDLEETFEYLVCGHTFYVHKMLNPSCPGGGGQICPT